MIRPDPVRGSATVPSPPPNLRPLRRARIARPPALPNRTEGVAMLQIEIESADGSKALLQVPDECVIGKGAQSEVHLEGWRVAKEHARLHTTPAGVLLEDMGAFGGVLVNGQRIDEQYGPLQPGDVIGIASYKLRVSVIGAASGIVQAAHPEGRSDTAGRRNLRATQDLAASRRRAETAQAEVHAQRECEGAAPHGGHAL